MLVVGLAGVASAQEAQPSPIEQRGQLWWLATAQGKLGPTARAYFEIQPRFGLTPQFRADAALVRAALGAEVLPGLTLWQGVGWIPSWADASIESVTTGEGRLYQQVQYVRALGPVGLVARLRLEERFIQNLGGVLLRTRLMVRFTWRFVEVPALQLAIHDELFVNLNQRTGSPPTGLDQNRAYVGLGWWVLPSVLLELGYQHQLVRRANPQPLRSGHTALLTTGFTF